MIYISFWTFSLFSFLYCLGLNSPISPFSPTGHDWCGIQHWIYDWASHWGHVLTMGQHRLVHGLSCLRSCAGCPQCAVLLCLLWGNTARGTVKKGKIGSVSMDMNLMCWYCGMRERNVTGVYIAYCYVFVSTFYGYIHFFLTRLMLISIFFTPSLSCSLKEESHSVLGYPRLGISLALSPSSISDLWKA